MGIAPTYPSEKYGYMISSHRTGDGFQPGLFRDVLAMKAGQKHTVIADTAPVLGQKRTAGGKMSSRRAASLKVDFFKDLW